MILCIETSAAHCSIALGDGSGSRVLKESSEINDHASKILSLIDSCLEETQTKLTDVDAIAVSQGPGSFTGLRVGVSTAKGLSFAMNTPLIGISTLAALAHTARGLHSQVPYICAMIKARKDEVYAAIFDDKGIPIVGEGVYTVYKGWHEELLKEAKEVIFCGNGVLRYQELCGARTLNYEPVTVSALNLIFLSWEKHIKKDYSEAKSFRPTYLKTAHITQPRKVL